MYNENASRSFREAIRPGLLPKYCNSAFMVTASSPNINGHWGTFRQLLLLLKAQNFLCAFKTSFLSLQQVSLFYTFPRHKKSARQRKKVVVNKCCAALSIALLANLFYRALALLHFVPTLKSRYELSPQRKIKFTFLPIFIAQTCF